MQASLPPFFSCNFSSRSSLNHFSLSLLQFLLLFSVIPLVGSSTRGSYPDLFELIPGRYNGTISLPQVLKELPNSPEGRQFILYIVNFIKNKTGLAIPQIFVNEILENFEVLLDFLALTVQEIRMLIDDVNILYQHGLIYPRPPDLEWALPRVFPMDQLDRLNIDLDMYQFPFENIGPDLYKGFLNSSDDPQNLKNSIGFAELLQRLSENYRNLSQPPTWMVEFNGVIYSRAEELISAMNQTGHAVEAYITCRVADFFGLWKKQGEKYLSIPVPLMIITDIDEISNTNDPPRKVTIPSEHCELVLKIKPPPDPHPKVKYWNLDLVWYEGTGSVGYIAKNLNTLTNWAGSVDRLHMNTSQIFEAVKYSSMYTDVLLQAQREHKLYNLGYGATGSCTDTVGLIGQLVFGNSDVFPFVLRKEYVIPVIGEKISQCQDVRLAAAYKRMYKAVEVLPVDYVPSETSPWRAFSQIPWEKGREPFACAERARETFQTMLMKNITPISAQRPQKFTIFIDNDSR